MTGLRIAAFQRRPRFGDIAGTADRLVADLAWCDGEGVTLALFPECYLQGYVLDRPAIGRVALALEEDEVLEGLLARLKLVRATFILGLIERHDRFLFNTAAVIRGGHILGAYRKINLHPKEKSFDAGRECPVFEAGDWRFGVNICYDGFFPEEPRPRSAARGRVSSVIPSTT